MLLSGISIPKIIFDTIINRKWFESRVHQQLRITRTITVAFRNRDSSDAKCLSCTATGSRECGLIDCKTLEITILTVKCEELIDMGQSHSRPLVTASPRRDASGPSKDHDSYLSNDPKPDACKGIAPGNSIRGEGSSDYLCVIGQEACLGFYFWAEQQETRSTR